MLKLSIITINYNNLDGLKRTVESVLSQTWNEFEYIIIDGGSTDGSKDYIESQDKIDYWVSERDSGIYNAMNKGIKRATGEYLLFLNSGDHLYNNKVLEQNHIFLRLKDIIYFNLQVIDTIKKYLKNYPEKLSFSYFLNDTLPHPATFIKKTLFDKIGLYDESLIIVSDWKFFIESICKFNSSYVKIDQTLSTFYLDGLSSDSQNEDLIVNEKQKVLNLEFGAFIDDISCFLDLKKQLEVLKMSKKIKILIKLGLLNKF